VRTTGLVNLDKILETHGTLRLFEDLTQDLVPKDARKKFEHHVSKHDETLKVHGEFPRVHREPTGLFAKNLDVPAILELNQNIVDTRGIDDLIKQGGFVAGPHPAKCFSTCKSNGPSALAVGSESAIKVLADL
jgi:hypothetical protein